MNLQRAILKKVEEAYNDHLESGYSFSEYVTSYIKEAQTYLEKAQNASDEAGRAFFSDRSLNCSLWGGERLVLEIAKANIEKYRKVGITIEVLDNFGYPVENVSVSIKQVSHDFIFGCWARGFFIQKIENFAAYKQRFKELFNSVGVPCGWSLVEPKEGQFNWEVQDTIVNWLNSTDLKGLGIQLFWNHEPALPFWARGLKYEDLKDRVYDYCYETVHRYRDEIKVWNIYNEPEWANFLDLSVDQQIEIFEVLLNASRTANPESVRMINPTLVWGEYVAWGSTIEGPTSRRLLTPYQFLTEVNDRGIEYEVIGLQLYMGFAGFTVRDMFTISRLLDKYSTLGKPIHVTELGVPSSFHNDEDAMVREVGVAGVWHKPWDEEIQADWVEQFYTIAFSKPYVRSIFWLDLADYSQRFAPWSGLLHGDMSPKQSYNRLSRLLASWMTSETGKTDSSGKCSFKGFKGLYEVTVKMNGEIVSQFHVHVYEEATITIKV